MMSRFLSFVLRTNEKSRPFTAYPRPKEQACGIPWCLDFSTADGATSVPTEVEEEKNSSTSSLLQYTVCLMSFERIKGAARSLNNPCDLWK